MKRKLLYAAGFILITCTFNACDLLSGNCEVCSLVSRDSYGNITASNNEAEYCDEELLAIKAISPTTVGGITTGWECN
jgi:hypothetical protein